MQYLTLIFAILLGGVIVGGSAFYYMRARFREAVESAPSNLASAAAPVAVAEEVKAIGSQIEQAMSEQRMQGETQRQLLAQKLDSVRQSIDAQRTHVDGLRSEMRHESKRRDQEMNEIRTQIGTLQTAPALPAADRLALPAAAPEAEIPADAEPVALPSTPESSAFEPVSFSRSMPAAPEPDGAPDAFEPAMPTDAPETEPTDPFGEITFGDSTAPADPSAPLTLAFQAPSSDPLPLQSDVFESWSPAPPAAAPFESPFFAEATFEDIGFAPVPIETFAQEVPSAAPSASEPSFAEASFDAPDQESDAPAMTDFTFSEMAPAPHVEEPREPAAEEQTASPAPVREPISAPLAAATMEPVADAPSTFETESFETASFETLSFETASFETVSFETVSFDPAPAIATASVAPLPAAASAIDLSWIARPNRPEPSNLAGEDLPTMASADDFLPLPAPTEAFAPTESAPSASVAPSGLIDMDAISAPALAPSPVPHSPPAPQPPVAPSLEPVAEALAPAAKAPVVETPAVSAPAAPAEDLAPAIEQAVEAPKPEPFAAPEGAEDLTVITSIDQDLQRLLYLEGVTTLEEIAQWGRTRARQIAVAVQISEETIMNQWVFEAQAAMFDQFSG